MFKKPIWIVFTIVSMAATQSLAGWSQFQGDAGHTGYVAESFDVDNFDLAWSLPLTNALDVATQDNVLFVTEVTGSSGTATVSRIDCTTGTINWSINLPFSSSQQISAPSVQGDTVFVHRWGHSGIVGAPPEKKPALIGINIETGNELFCTQHYGQWHSGSRPTVTSDAVFAAGGYSGGLDVYDLDGTKMWFAGLEQRYGWIPAADADNIYVYIGKVGSAPGRLYIIDQQTHSNSSIYHPRSTGAFMDTNDNGSVMLDGIGNAYALSLITISGNRTLVSFDIDANTINWEADGSWEDNPAIKDGMIAVPEGNSLVFLDAATGTRQWSWDHAAYVSGNVILTDNLAFVNTDTGTYAIDLDSHTTVWNTPIQGNLAADEGMLYITNETGVFAFHAVPEPSSLILIASMLLVGLWKSKRRRS